MVGLVLGGGGKGGVILPALSNPAVAGNVLQGKDFINAANERVVGTIISKAAQTYTPGTSAQTIAAGQYLSGTQTIAAIPSTHRQILRTTFDFFSSSIAQVTTFGGLAFTPTQIFMVGDGSKAGYNDSQWRLRALVFSSGVATATFLKSGAWKVYDILENGTVMFGSNSVTIDLTRTDADLYFNNIVYQVVLIS